MTRAIFISAPVSLMLVVGTAEVNTPTSIPKGKPIVACSLGIIIVFRPVEVPVALSNTAALLEISVLLTPIPISKPIPINPPSGAAGETAL